jgi:hypothetical protein
MTAFSGPDPLPGTEFCAVCAITAKTEAVEAGLPAPLDLPQTGVTTLPHPMFGGIPVKTCWEHAPVGKAASPLALPSTGAITPRGHGLAG